MTNNPLHTRLKQHMYSGAIKEHIENEHLTNLTIEMLKNQSIISGNCKNPTKLPTYETLHILYRGPSMNRQSDSLERKLKLFEHIPPNEVQLTKITFGYTNVSVYSMKDIN